MFRATDMCGYSAYDWKTIAIFRLRGGRSFTMRPPMRISPAVGCSSPAIMRSRVVLPHPDGPSSTRNSPSRVARSTPSTARTSPNAFVMRFVSTVANYTRPFSFHLAKMRLQAVSASFSASSGLAEPLAAFANMTFSTQVLKISSMAALA